MQKQSFSWPVIVLLTLITVLLAGVLYMFFVKGGTGMNSDALQGSSETVTEGQASAFTAVFLTNGQAYFGKLTEGEDTDTLTDVYYISASPQSPDSASADTKNNVSLIKLGSEIHGPTDEMKINRDQIMFTETLREDSQVVKAIASQESGQ